jgi:hypothetical protein
MATNPQYAATPGRANVATGSTAATDMTGSSTTAVVSGTANGRRIRRVAVSHNTAPTSNANVVRFFISLDSGTTKRFLCDVALSAATISATVRGQYAEVPELVGLILQGTTTQLYAGPYAAQSQVVDCEYADL